MNNIKFCYECAKDVKTKIIESEEIFNVKGTEIKILSKKRACAECGEEISDVELDDATLTEVYEQYKTINNMLTSKEIKKIREKYFISQKGLATLLAWGEKTITRYENGSLQDKTHDSILRTIKNQSKFIEYWEKNKHKLSETERSKVEVKLNMPKSNVFFISVAYKNQSRLNVNNSIICYAETKEFPKYENELELVSYC